MVLTRFEKARIVGARSLQIAMGAPILVKKKSKIENITDVVIEEFEAGVLPLTVIRKMPNGSQMFLDVKGEVLGETEKQSPA